MSMADKVGPFQPTNDFWNALGWQPLPEQLEQFKLLQALLEDWNKHVNLTRLVSGHDFWVNQIFDSLWPLQRLLNQPQTLKCIDVGTGGGFPGLAVAIALPNISMTLVDSIGRKTKAVTSIVKDLGISHRVSLRTERIEKTGQNHNYRSRFDLAMARAVAITPTVAEYLLPLLSRSGEALLYRGQCSDVDTHELNLALQLLGGRIRRLDHCKLLGNRGVRHAITIEQCIPCPDIYPRLTGLPTKEPLGSVNDRSEV
ncbi:putative glucose inhibited division protein B (chromatophore) [Paulinella micropora]|uniref:Glucose inhibited division protein B n=1 Tax=Paulinella micropora TaxID=1928728 RepID=A0A1L5YB87_9EUKA|nr:putative glucose inhibited division protein B [Paulinella micropora]AQX44739.1 putative glucose inhibited division protein B [Paulinella micropora]BBL85951.1 putative glucose inhibited division protein B [Paulinella micropora]